MIVEKSKHMIEKMSLDRVVREKLQDFRTKLLDLTGRNPLLNFRLSSDRSRTHVRLVDELPDFLFGALSEGNKLTFKPLPPLDNEPHDEKDRKFQSAYRQAKLTDELYIKEIEALADKEDTFDEVALIERRLKDRVRVQLGMPLLKDLKPLSNAEWARRHNLEPQYDLPFPKAEDIAIGKKPDKHFDDWMQTLHLPKELEQKLQGLKRYISADINETGVNTFYAAFGFLQWYDKENADKPYFAPLMLLQLDPMTEKKTRHGEVFYAVEASGEEPQYNLPLAERLKEFGLALPELDENDTPESYMQKVERLIKNKPKWRVRRFVTIGRFQFARLVMYHDLNPDKWPTGAAINDNPIIKGLLSGHTGNSGGSGELETYDIDTDPEVEQAAPILITEADSSQHSAIVDVLKGQNLVIKGPPGTGKSQTITNLIANSLAKGKKVLFIAEKMAALDVVYSRLKNANLGDFCLELHSTKSKLKDVRDNLAICLENRKLLSKPKALPEKILELKKAKLHLRQYSDILNQPLGSTGKTVHDVLWSEQARRNMVATQPAFIKGIRIKKADTLNLSEIASYCDDLRKFEELSRENAAYTSANHPWKGVGLSQISGLKISEIIQAAEECFDAVKAAVESLKWFEEKYGWNTGGTLNTFDDFRRSWIEVYEYKAALNPINFDLLPHLAANDKILEIEVLVSQIEDYKAQAKLSSDIIKSPEKILSRHNEVSVLCKQAQSLGIDNLTAAQIHEHVDQLKKVHALWHDIEPRLSFMSLKLLGKENPTIKEIALILEATRLLTSISRDALLRRSEDAVSETSEPILCSAIEKQKVILEVENSLKQVLDLKLNITEQDLDTAIYELSNSGLLSYLKSDFYKARKTYRALRLVKTKANKSQCEQELRSLKQYREDVATFGADARYHVLAGKFFEGVSTDFSLLRELNKWAQDVRRAFAFGITEEKLKTFLLSGSISEIDDIISQMPNQVLEAVKEAIASAVNKEVSVRDHINNQIDVIKNGSGLAEGLEQLAASDTVKFCDLNKLLKTSFVKMAGIVEKIEAGQQRYKFTIGESYFGVQTDIEPIRNSVALARLIQSLMLPNSVKAELYNDRIFDKSESVCNDLSAFYTTMCKARQRIDVLGKHSALDFGIYVGAKEIGNTSLVLLKTTLQQSLSDRNALTVLVKCNDFMEQSRFYPYHDLLKAQQENHLAHEKLAELFEYLVYRTLSDSALQEHSVLDDRSLLSLDQIRKKFQQLDKEIMKLQCIELAYQLYRAKPQDGISSGYVSDYSDMGLIRHQVQGKARQIPLRRFIERAGNALQTLKPCFLMSPLSVAQYISPTSIKFDLVVIDEASQMCPEDALGAIARSGQIVVVGDPQQLPPTAFFQKQLSESSDDYEEEDKLDNESILDMAYSRYFPPRELLWHYRSRHESLIAFSNLKFYNKRLIVFPSPESISDRFGVSNRYIGGIYNASCNVDEAKAVVDAARQFMRDNPDKSLGIATMNSQQRDLIDEEIYRLFLEDEYAEAYRQKWGATLEPFFVKNLESVQGDERDTIFVSTVYGPSSLGAKPAQRFGPINGKFGHRRLNVLFTRAKHNLVLFTSLLPDQIVVSENSSQGLKAFKAYLEYAATGKIDSGIDTGRSTDSDFEDWVMARLESKGYQVTPQIGVAGYFIDLGLKHPDYPYGYLLGIECDGAMYHSSKSARDRDRIRQEVLEGLGWSLYRIWSTAWFHNPDREFEKLVEHIEHTFRIKSDQRQENMRRHKLFVKQFQREIQPKLFDEITPAKAKSSVEDFSDVKSAVSNDNVIDVFDTVSFEFLDTGCKETMTVTLVTSQSHVDSGLTNQHTPIGRALIGCRLNDEVDIEFPKGARPVQIKSIQKYKGSG